MPGTSYKPGSTASLRTRVRDGTGVGLVQRLTCEQKIKLTFPGNINLPLTMNAAMMILAGVAQTVPPPTPVFMENKTCFISFANME